MYRSVETLIVLALDKQYLLIWGYHIDWDIIVLLCGKTGNAINTVYRDLSQSLLLNYPVATV